MRIYSGAVLFAVAGVAAAFTTPSTTGKFVNRVSISGAQSDTAIMVASQEVETNIPMKRKRTKQVSNSDMVDNHLI